MKLTYTAPNRAHHYPYADAFNNAEVLHAFVSGFSRFSPRADLPSIGDKLKRFDLIQNLYIASLKFKAPTGITNFLNTRSHLYLDHASYQWAKESDVFIYYRTEGRNTALKIHKKGLKTLCVLEEVNSHVDVCTELLNTEYEKLGFGKSTFKFPDHDLRLKAYDEADYILCPSEFVKRSFLVKGFAESKLLKVNFGFPKIQTDNTEVEKDGVFRVLYVGQIHYRKGLHYAIEAFKKLKHPKKEFVIVGPKTAITGLEKTIIPDGVVFTGALKGEELKREFKRSSVFVLPSVEEGLALVQGEALAFGKPLIITTNTGGDDLITNGVEGFIVTPSNASEIADAMQKLADDADLLQAMSNNAILAAKTLGGWEVSVNNLLVQLEEKLALRHEKI